MLFLATTKWDVNAIETLKFLRNFPRIYEFKIWQHARYELKSIILLFLNCSDNNVN